jgi:hypothetical protein
MFEYSLLYIYIFFDFDTLTPYSKMNNTSCESVLITKTRKTLWMIRWKNVLSMTIWSHFSPIGASSEIWRNSSWRYTDAASHLRIKQTTRTSNEFCYFMAIWDFLYIDLIGKDKSFELWSVPRIIFHILLQSVHTFVTSIAVFYFLIVFIIVRGLSLSLWWNLCEGFLHWFFFVSV